MKNIKALYGQLLLALCIPFASISQESNAPVSSLLGKYLDIKNALISGKTTDAANAATDFVALTKKTDSKVLSAKAQQSFKESVDQLMADAITIASSKNLEKQRVAFQSLSEAFIAFAKASNTGRKIYIDYCPMKKAYWMSMEEAIKNPYYGSSMLTCGKVSEVLQ